MMSPQGQHAIDVYRGGQNPILSQQPGGPVSVGGGQAVARAAPYAMDPRVQQFLQAAPQMAQQARAMMPPQPPMPQMPGRPSPHMPMPQMSFQQGMPVGPQVNKRPPMGGEPRYARIPYDYGSPEENMRMWGQPS